MIYMIQGLGLVGNKGAYYIGMIVAFPFSLLSTSKFWDVQCFCCALVSL